MDTALPSKQPIVLFDGVCNLCTGIVQFLIERDPEGRLRFASLQSEAGRSLARRFDLDVESPESFVLVEGDEYYTASTAALRITRHLGGIYAVVYPLRYIPRPVRDAVYGFVATHRYAWFGKRESCMVPNTEMESQFLD